MPRLITIPALVDPHVHFRTPGGEHKEDWNTGTQAALAGGVTTVFDMPNTNPPTTTLELVRAKKTMIEKTLTEYKRVLRYYFYLGATATNLAEIARCQNEIIGVKLFMGASTGNLQVEDDVVVEEIFRECGRLGIVLAIHCEDEAVLQQAKSDFVGTPTARDHGRLRPRTAAITALQKAIQWSEKYQTRVYVLHVSTAEEIELIKAAKAKGIAIFAEVTPHHLFLNETDLEHLGNLGKMNPPLRTATDQAALWSGIHDGTVDTIGTDHAPHTLEEKNLDYAQAPSGVPGIETYLALLLDANHRGLISLDEITRLTRTNIQRIFNLPENNDTVTIDLELVKIIRNEDMLTKCKWSPFAGKTLNGWPILAQIKD